jgi:glycosyltransferase involved in cell wall biosynthesis
MQLHWVCNAPSPYNDYLFACLGQRSNGLEVHYREYPGSPNLVADISGNYQHRYYRTFAGIDWALCWAVLKDRRSVLLTGCWQDRSCQLLLVILMLLRRPYLIWNDTPQPKQRPWLKEQIRSLFLKLVFRRALAVMGTGPRALETFASMGCPNYRLVNFPCFVNLDFFKPHDFEPPQQNIVVFGSCGRLDRIKNFDLALQVLRRAKAAGLRFQYHIAGAGPHEAALRNLAIECGLSEEVHFHGWVRQKDLPDFYRRVDILLHPADHEGYCVAVLEAMASGCVVVASSSTAAATDRVIDGWNGFLHDTGNTESLCNAIQRALACDRTALGRRARLTAEEWPITRGLVVLERLLRSGNGQRLLHSEVT